MDWQQNINAILVLIGTLSGALIGIWGNFVTNKWQLKRLKVQWRKEYKYELAEQIRNTVDDTLKIMTDADFDIIMKSTVSIDTLPTLKKAMAMKASMTARILAFDDKELQKGGVQFSNSIIKFSRAQNENERLLEIDKAIQAAGIIFKRLGESPILA